MPELQDYSGPFNPKARYKDFSKDVLLVGLSILGDLRDTLASKVGTGALSSESLAI